MVALIKEPFLEKETLWPEISRVWEIRRNAMDTEEKIKETFRISKASMHDQNMCRKASLHVQKEEFESMHGID